MTLGWASGKHALVTGGGTGIGAAAARMLAGEGAKVSLVGRRREPLEAVATETGGAAYPADMTDRAAMEAAFAAARAASGPFDYVILNAGIGDSAPFLRTPRDTWDRIIATNLTALFDGAQLTLPDLIEGEDKRLIIVASVAGLKGGMHTLVGALVKDLQDRGVVLPTHQRVDGIRKAGTGWQVSAGDSTYDAGRLVVALDGPAAVGLLADSVPALAGLRPEAGPLVSLVTPPRRSSWPTCRC